MQFLHELAEKAVHMKNIRFNMKRAYKIRRDLTEQVEVGEGVTLTFKRGEAKYLKQIAFRTFQTTSISMVSLVIPL